jgi:hypothetical protein
MATFSNKKFVKHDDYMTPKYAWEDIKKYIPSNKIIWEGFYGDGLSGKYLTELGFKVVHEPIDFFNEEPLEWDVLVSNPPFSKSKEVLQRIKELDKPFILIMPVSKLNTSYTRKLFKDDKDLQIIIPKKRIYFLKKINGEVPEDWGNSCNFDCFYYCYKINLPSNLVWLD